MINFIEKDMLAPIEYVYKIDNILYSTKSKFQDIKVIENTYFGKMLVLDDIVQLTERDEFFYHEMIAHIPMHAHPGPRRVVIIGGGDGGTVREVLKHKSVEKVYFIEIDEEVINVSKKFFPSLSSELDNPLLEIKCMDGAEFLKTHKDSVDVIIVDSTDIVGSATSLYTKEFFQSVEKCLSADGFFVTHSETLLFHKDLVIDVQEKLRNVFPVVDLYTVTIATYAGNWWTFSIASKNLSPREMRRTFEIPAKYYDNEVHITSFLAKSLYARLMQKKLDW
jgi:spermidine synthase